MSLVATVRTRLAVLVTITLVVSASLSLFAAPVLATDVGTESDFRTAWAANGTTLISLTSNITLACTAIVDEVETALNSPERNSATDIVIDGNGKTLHNPCSFHGLLQQGGGKVTLQDLTFTGNDSSDDGLNTQGVVAVTDSHVTGHGDGGVQAEGDVSADGSTISDNVGSDGIRSDGDVTVSDSTITGNAADESSCGDGIDAEGDVTVNHSTVSGNGDNGILAEGDITVGDSIVADNGTAGECDQDGIRTTQGTATVLWSTVSGNEGHGIFAKQVTAIASTITNNDEDGIRAGTVNVTNSTITAQDGEVAAGIRASGAVNATHATISGNAVNIDNVQGPAIHLFGTVLVDALSANCLGAVTDDGHNFVDDDTCDDIAENLDDPMLGALADNGGPTWTRLPAAGSPLLNAIPSGDCEIATEQRGLFARPQGAGCDIGSVEVQAAPVATPSPSPTPIPTPSPSGSAIPTASAIPTLPPTSAAAVEESAPATGSIVLVVGLLAAVLLVSLARPRIPGRP